MTQSSDDTTVLIQNLRSGAPDGLVRVFYHFRPRLRRMVEIRLDPRLRGRLDASDVLQEAYLDLVHDLPAYLADPQLDPLLWLRLHVGRRLMGLHRHHLGTLKRDAALDVSIFRQALPEASSVALAKMLLGRLTSPSQRLLRVERLQQVQQALNGLDPMDREILTLRHFEQLNRVDTATILGLSPDTAAKRYFRALQRLKAALGRLPGGPDGFN